MRKIFIYILCIISIFMLCGCSSSGIGNNQRTSVSDVEISDKELNLQLNQTYKLSANVLPKNATNKKVRWESSDTNIVTVTKDGSIFAKGIGSALIKVFSESNKTIYNYCIVYVSGNYTLVFENSFPSTFYREWVQSGILIGEMSLKVNSISYYFTSYTDHIYINLTLLCVKTYASGYYKNSSFKLNCKVYDEQNVLKTTTSIDVSSSVNEDVEKMTCILLRYNNTCPLSASFKIVIS